MKQRAVIFDMDGVIADTNPYHTKAFEAFFGKYHITYSQEDMEQHIYGKHNSYIMRHFFGQDLSNEEVDRLEEEKESLFREIYKDHVTPIKGLPTFLDALSKHDDFQLGVATSAPRANMDLILGKLGIRRYFQSTLSSEHVTKHKPDPEIYLKSADILGISPTQCLVFEDSFSGATAGLRAEMTVVGVLTSHQPKDLPTCAAYIKDYADIDVDRIISMLD